MAVLRQKTGKKRGREMLTAFRAAFACASLLCIAEPAAGGGAYLGVSLVVSGAFLLLGGLLNGVHRSVTGMARELRRLAPEGSEPLAMHLRRLVARLLVGGIVLCVLLGSLTAAILRRIDQGLAVFG
jgi:hypothetical protein